MPSLPCSGPPNPPGGLWPLLLVLLSCSHPVPPEEIRFANQSSLGCLSWKCHVQFTIEGDTLSGEPFLRVFSRKQDYPGMLLPWTNGDWRGYSTFCIESRSGNEDMEPFYLTIWDGEGDYEYRNRYQGNFILTREFQEHCVDLRKPLRSPGNRSMDLSRIKNVVFFSASKSRPHRFDVRRVYFKKKGAE